MSRSIDHLKKKSTQDNKKKLDLDIFRNNRVITSKEYGTDYSHVGSIHVSMGQMLPSKS